MITPALSKRLAQDQLISVHSVHKNNAEKAGGQLRNGRKRLVCAAFGATMIAAITITAVAAVSGHEQNKPTRPEASHIEAKPAIWMP
jgi:hypothetical protein